MTSDKTSWPFAVALQPEVIVIVGFTMLSASSSRKHMWAYAAVALSMRPWTLTLFICLFISLLFLYDFFHARSLSLLDFSSSPGAHKIIFFIISPLTTSSFSPFNTFLLSMPLPLYSLSFSSSHSLHFSFPHPYSPSSASTFSSSILPHPYPLTFSLAIFFLSTSFFLSSCVCLFVSACVRENLLTRFCTNTDQWWLHACTLHFHPVHPQLHAKNTESNRKYQHLSPLMTTYATHAPHTEKGGNLSAATPSRGSLSKL